MLNKNPKFLANWTWATVVDKKRHSCSQEALTAPAQLDSGIIGNTYHVQPRLKLIAIS